MLLFELSKSYVDASADTLCFFARFLDYFVQTLFLEIATHHYIRVVMQSDVLHFLTRLLLSYSKSSAGAQ